MFQIDDELKEFSEAGVAANVGSVGPDGRPQSGAAWGPRVHEGGTRITVYLDGPRAEPVLAGFRANGRIALTIADPVSYRSVQFKGHVTHIGDANEAEEQWVERHRNAFRTSVALVGEPPEVVRNRWMEAPVVRVDFDVEQAFDQTPGPNAGMPL